MFPGISNIFGLGGRGRSVPLPELVFRWKLDICDNDIFDSIQDKLS
jgi:hypothetical protein